jgi:hypothetical protein
VVSIDEPPQTLAVLGMSRVKWAGKEGKPDTMMVTYATLEAAIKEWVCFNHAKGSFPHDKARGWHKKHCGSLPMPDNVDDAVKFEFYQAPDFVTVRKEGKFWRVLDYQFLSHEERNEKRQKHGDVNEIRGDCEIPF